MTVWAAARAIPGGTPTIGHPNVGRRGFVETMPTGNLEPLPRLPTLCELQALAELARHGGFKQAAWCRGLSENTVKNQAFRAFVPLGAMSSIEALTIIGWLVPPPIFLGCEP